MCFLNKILVSNCFLKRKADAFSSFSADAVQRAGGYSMLVRHLIQIPGVSINIAAPIAKKYLKPSELFKIYFNPNIPINEKETLLAEIPREGGQKTIGPSLSRKIYNSFTSNDPMLYLTDLSTANQN